MGSVTAQAPIATGAAMGNRLQEEHTHRCGHGGSVQKRSPQAKLGQWSQLAQGHTEKIGGGELKP